MKVSLEERDGQRGIEVTVIAPPRDPRVPRLLAAIRLCGGRISGYESASSARRRVVALADVCSVRTAGDYAELLLADGTTLQSASRLGELEAALAGAPEGDVTPQRAGYQRVCKWFLAKRRILDNALTIRPEFAAACCWGSPAGTRRWSRARTRRRSSAPSASSPKPSERGRPWARTSRARRTASFTARSIRTHPTGGCAVSMGCSWAAPGPSRNRLLGRGEWHARGGLDSATGMVLSIAIAMLAGGILQQLWFNLPALG